MDRSAIEELQMHGQDIPWLLAHWATHKPDHPALVWDPPDGAGRSWTWAELLDATQGMAVGLRDRGIEVGDKVLIHGENSPEVLLAWLACATVGAVAVTTNTRSVVSEIAYFAEHTGCVAAIADARFADAVGEAAPKLQWIAVIPDGDGGDATAGGDGRPDHIPFAALVGRCRGVDRSTRSSRCGRSASCSRRARRAGPRRWCTPTPTRCGPAASARATSTSAPTTAT